MDTQDTTRARYAFGITLFVVVIILALFFMNKKAAAPSMDGVASTTPTTTSTTTVQGTSVDLGNGVVAHLPPGATLSTVDDKVPVPSLTSAIVFGTSVTQETQAVIRANEEALIVQLKSAPNRVDLWLKLGGYRKMAGDYQGAVVAWQYVAAAGPKSINYVAYGNLGDLYMNFLKDYTKAESNYKTAINLSPTTIDYYRSLSMLYTNQLRDTARARATLQAGLNANPGNADLIAALKALQ